MLQGLPRLVMHAGVVCMSTSGCHEKCQVRHNQLDKSSSPEKKPRPCSAKLTGTEGSQEYSHTLEIWNWVSGVSLTLGSKTECLSLLVEN